MMRKSRIGTVGNALRGVPLRQGTGLHGERSLQFLAILSLMQCLIFTVSAHATEDKAPGLILADGTMAPGQIVSVQNGALELQATDDAKPHRYAAGEWLRWSHPIAPAARPRVHLSDSTWLVTKADWTGKIPIAVEGEQVIIKTTSLVDVQVDRREVACMLLEAAQEPAVALRLLAEAISGNQRQDRVWLVEGDLLNGKVESFDGQELAFRLGDELVPIAAPRIAAIAFATSNEREQEASGPLYLVGLRDGSQIEATEVALDGGQLTLTMPWGGAWKSTRGGALRFVQSLAENVVYLSDLDPVDYRHTPYFAQSWPLVRDRSLSGGSLTAGGERYAKGLAMHSAARAVYRIPEGVGRFCTEVAMDDAAGDRGSVVFRVYLASTDGLTPAYESPVVRGGESPRSVQVELKDAAAVVLVVDFADYGDELDHAVWLDARFVR